MNTTMSRLGRNFLRNIEQGGLSRLRNYSLRDMEGSYLLRYLFRNRNPVGPPYRLWRRLPRSSLWDKPYRMTHPIYKSIVQQGMEQGLMPLSDSMSQADIE